MTSTSTPRGRRTPLRVVGALATAALLGVASLSAAALPAHALDGLPTAPGTGEGSITIQPGTTTSDATITVSGSGFVERPADGFLAFKINDGKNPDLKLPADGQTQGTADASGTLTVSDPSHLPNEDGTFSVDITLPTFPEDGEYWIRVLGGNDGGEAVSKWAAFTVSDDQVTPTEQSLSVSPASTATTGVVTVPASGSGFTAGADLTASVDGTEAAWSQGRSTVATISVGEDGTFTGTVSILAGAAPAGEHTLTLTSSAGETADVTFTTSPAVSFASGSAANSTSDVTVVNLPTGTVVTGIGVEGTNWIEGSHTVSEGTEVTVPQVDIPQGTTSGQAIVLTYSVDGVSTTVTTSVVVTPDNSPVNEDDYSSDSAELPSGLYQSAYSTATGALFATSAVGRPPVTQSQLIKLDPDTLEVLDSTTPALVDATDPDGGVWAVYGIGLDDELGYVWVTNTRQNTVAVYDQETLDLVKQFPADTTAHSRDVVVDASTHLAYVSSASGDYIDVFSGAGDEPVYVERITLSSDAQAFDTVMRLDFDQTTGMLYTTSLGSQVAASIDTRNGNAITYYPLGDHVSSASGVAYDPVAKNLYVASQVTNNVVVVNTVSGKIVADIPTGAGSLNAAYDADNGLVYVANRTGATVTVINASTLQVVGNLPAGTNTNHVEVAQGVAYVVDKGTPNQIHRFVPSDSALTATSTLPSDGADLEASLELGSDALSDSSPEAGDTLTVTIGEEYAGQLVDVYLFSDPSLLTPDGVVVSQDGSFEVTLPADASEGDHRIAVTNRYGLVLKWAALDVAADDQGAGDGDDDQQSGGQGGTDGSTDSTGSSSTGGTDTSDSSATSATTGLATTGFDPSLAGLAALLLLGGAAALAPRLRAKH